MITDQANAAAESNGRFFLTKRVHTNRFAQNESENRFKSQIGMLKYNGLSISDNIDGLASRFKVIPGHAFTVAPIRDPDR